MEKRQKHNMQTRELEELEEVVYETWCCSRNLSFETAQKINNPADPKPILDQILERFGLLENYNKCGRPVKNFEFWWFLAKRKKSG